MRNRPDELRRQLGTLWRTAMVGLDTVREVALRSSQSGRLRVDIALLRNERSQLLQELGEQTVRMLDEGSFDDASEAMRTLYDRVKDVEARIRSDSARATDNAFGAPRGFEPEAAADYGDSDGVEDPPPPAPKSAKRKSPKRKEAAK
jgi:hypothetical protein